MSSFEAIGKTEADLEGCIICICSGTDLVNLNFMFMVAENPDTARVDTWTHVFPKLASSALLTEDVKCHNNTDEEQTSKMSLMFCHIQVSAVLYTLKTIFVFVVSRSVSRKCTQSKVAKILLQASLL